MKRFLLIVLCGIGFGSSSFAESTDINIANSDKVAVKDDEVKSDDNAIVLDSSDESSEQANVDLAGINIDVPADVETEQFENDYEQSIAGSKISSYVNVVFDEAANSIDICNVSAVLSDKIVELEKSKSEFPEQANDELAKFISVAQKISVSDLSEMSSEERASLLDDLSCSYNNLMIVLEESL